MRIHSFSHRLFSQRHQFTTRQPHMTYPTIPLNHSTMISQPASNANDRCEILFARCLQCVYNNCSSSPHYAKVPAVIERKRVTRELAVVVVASTSALSLSLSLSPMQTNATRTIRCRILRRVVYILTFRKTSYFRKCGYIKFSVFQ